MSFQYVTQAYRIVLKALFDTFRQLLPTFSASASFLGHAGGRLMHYAVPVASGQSAC